MEYIRGKLKGRPGPPEGFRGPLESRDIPSRSLNTPSRSLNTPSRSLNTPTRSLNTPSKEVSPPLSMFGRRWREGSERSRTFWNKSAPWSRRGSQSSSTNDENSFKYVPSSPKAESSLSKYTTKYAGSNNCYNERSFSIDRSGAVRYGSSPQRLQNRSRAESRTRAESRSRAESSSRAQSRSRVESRAPADWICSRCSMSPAPYSPLDTPIGSPPPLIEYNPLDYKSLFEKERDEKQVVSHKVQELEGRQKLLEQSLAKFLDLRRELRELNSQAEEADSLIDSIIQEAVPGFATKRRKSSTDEEESYNETRSRLKLFRGGRMELGNCADLSPTPSRNTSPEPSTLYNSTLYNSTLYRARPAVADPDIPKSPSPPPLPAVSYTWDQCNTTPSPLYQGRYTYSSRIPSRLDELKLNLKFDVSSSLLPTKLQLEIKDKEGRVVFRKRQNLYYVKVQERLSTLDAAEDYIMTVTSITGDKKATEDVTIHNKNYRDDSYARSYATPGYDVTESVTLPYTCRSPSDSSLTSGFDERSIDSIFDVPIRSIEATYEEVCRAATETPLPDLEEVEIVDEEIVESDPEPEEMDESEEEPTEEEPVQEPVEEQRRNPFLLLKKPVVPQLEYRWQYGFRRTEGCIYKKVPILKVQFRYTESSPLLPAHLDICVGADTKTIPVGPTGSGAEFVFQDGVAPTLIVTARDKTGQPHLSSPKFSLVPLSFEGCMTGEWYSEVPLLQLEY